MSVFRNILVVGVIGVVLSDGGESFSAPLPIHLQSNAPENSMLDPEEVKGKSVEVKETQGEESDVSSLEKATQFKPEGSLLKKLKSNYSGIKVPSNRYSEVNINKQLPKLKPNKERISALKELENLYKNKDSLLAKLKFPIKEENISPSALQFKQNINHNFAANKNQKIRIDSEKNVESLGKSNSSILELLESKSENSEENISPSALQFKQNINHNLAANKNQKIRIDSEKNVEILGKSNSSLLELLESKSGNSGVATNINFPEEISFQESITFSNNPERLSIDSENNVENLGKSNSIFLELLESKSGNLEVANQINFSEEISFQESITFSNNPEKLSIDSENNVENLGKSNSIFLELLESKSGNLEVANQINFSEEISFQESTNLLKHAEIFNLDLEKYQVENGKNQTDLKASTPEIKNQKNETNNSEKISERNPILGNSYQVMTSINRAPTMATINDLSEVETQASVLNNPQKNKNNPIRLVGRTNNSLVSIIQRPPTFGNTSKQQNSVQIKTGLNQTSTMNTVPNLARVENQKHLSNNSSLIIAQQNNESFPPPVPNGTLQTNPPPQIEPNSNPLYFPVTPDQVQIKETIPITLEEAIDLARRNNPDIQIVQLEVDRSKAALREAQAALWPSLTFESVIQRTENAGGDLQAQAQKRVNKVTGRDELIDTDIQNFPTTTFSNTFRFDYDLGLGKARSSRIGVAREQIRLRELELERFSEELRLNVSDDYYNLQQADGRVKIGEAAVRNSRKSLEDAEALERAGVGTRFDVLQAQVTLSNEQQSLTNALRDQRTTQRRLAERLSANELINLTAADPIEPVGSWPLSLDETIVAAFRNRAELEQQLVQRDLSDEQRKLALSSVRPSLNFFATYNVLALTTENQSWRAARGWADGSTIGLRFRWNFFDGGAARASARQSILNGEIAETRFEQVRNQIRREVEEAFFGLEASFENIDTAELGVEQAKEALRLARLRFQAGVGTQLEVIQQETDLTRAEDNLLRAIIDYNRSLSELQRAVSNLPDGSLSNNP